MQSNRRIYYELILCLYKLEPEEPVRQTTSRSINTTSARRRIFNNIGGGDGRQNITNKESLTETSKKSIVTRASRKYQ